MAVSISLACLSALSFTPFPGKMGEACAVGDELEAKERKESKKPARRRGLPQRDGTLNRGKPGDEPTGEASGSSPETPAASVTSGSNGTDDQKAMNSSLPDGEQNKTTDAQQTTVQDMTKKSRSRSPEPQSSSDKGKRSVFGRYKKPSDASSEEKKKGTEKGKEKKRKKLKKPLSNVTGTQESPSDDNYNIGVGRPSYWQELETSTLYSTGQGKVHLNNYSCNSYAFANLKPAFGRFYKEENDEQVLPKNWAVYLDGKTIKVDGKKIKFELPPRCCISSEGADKPISIHWGSEQDSDDVDSLNEKIVLLIDSKEKEFDHNTMIALQVRIDPPPSEPIKLQVALISKDKLCRKSHVFVEAKEQHYYPKRNFYMYSGHFVSSRQEMEGMSKEKYPGFCWYGRENQTLEIVKMIVCCAPPHDPDSPEKENELTEEQINELGTVLKLSD